MSTTLVTVEPDATVADAAQLMSIHHVGAALVLAGDTLYGIFTERDIVRAAGHTVTGWMSHDPVTLPPEATVAEAHERMMQEGFRHIPILEHGRLVGIVSLRDLSRRLR